MSNRYDIENQNTSDTPPGSTLHDDDAINVKSDAEHVYLGDHKYKKSDLMHAFGGTLQPGPHPAPQHHFANPAPLGLSAFALTTFVLSLVNCQARGVTTPNIVVGLACFYGGLIQLLAGMWEISLQNTFGGLALSSYGGFWMSYAAISIDWFGIGAAYETETELANAVGFYLLAWCIFTFGLCSLTLRSTIMFFSLFFFLGITFLLLAIAEFSGNAKVAQGGGGVGVVTAIIAWYNAYAGVASKENCYFTIDGCRLPWDSKKED